MTTATQQDVTFFNLKTPYLSQGVTTDYRAQTDLLSVAVKVYAEGGENRLHIHPDEDHAFVVVEGEATFHVGSVANPFAADTVQVVGRFDGVMLPKGTPYYFHSTGADNLVLIRVGGTEPGDTNRAIYPDGQEKAREFEPPKNRLPRVEREGKGFGD